ARDWARTDALLLEAVHRVPASLSEARVDTAWRNARRELRGIQLRRAVALWMLGRTDDAAAEAARATETDAESVRSAALLLQSAADIADGRRETALARLDALSGHDVRFAAPIASFASALATDGATDAAAVAALTTTLVTLDRSREPVVDALGEIL